MATVSGEAITRQDTDRSILNILTSLYRPKSILRLILIGFIIILFPLMFALANVVYSVKELSERSQEAVFTAAEVTNTSRRLVERVTMMERAARQYVVLGDADLFEVYNQSRDRFYEHIHRLREFGIEDDQIERLSNIEATEARIYETMLDSSHSDPTVAVTVSRFSDISNEAQALLASGSRLIYNEIERMQRTSDEATNRLIWQATALVPVVIILVILFTILITRPIRRLEDVIHRMGDGDFQSPIAVRGPRDIEGVSQRLEWLRSRLCELEKEKNKLMHHVSHELKTPLATVREGAELLNDEIVGRLSPQQREIARLIRDNSVNLQKLIEDLLNISLTQTTRSALNLDTIEVNKLIRETVEHHSPVIMKKGIRISLNIDSCHIIGDTKKLRTVVDNLLSNAIKYSPPNGYIRIQTTTIGDSIHLDVCDSGPGIHATDEEKIFDAFYQGAPPPDGCSSGSGLGLSITKEYVRAHGGHIDIVKDDCPGAHIRITIPIDASNIHDA